MTLADLLRRRGFQPSKHAGLLNLDKSLTQIVGNEDDPDEERAWVAQLVQEMYRSERADSPFRQRWLYRSRDVACERLAWQFALREVHGEWALQAWQRREGNLKPPAPSDDSIATYRGGAPS